MYLTMGTLGIRRSLSAFAVGMLPKKKRIGAPDEGRLRLLPTVMAEVLFILSAYGIALRWEDCRLDMITNMI